MKNKAARDLEEKNAVLVKANLDKEKLLTIAKSNIPKEVTSEILSIASSTDAMPDVKLTKREMQIAESLRRITHKKGSRNRLPFCYVSLPDYLNRSCATAVM